MPAHPVGLRLGKRVAAECAAIDKALRDRTQIQGRVHEARKAIRRVRALLALVERHLDVAAEDRVLQQMGDGLSALRDAFAASQVAVEVGKIDGRARWSPVAKALRKRADDVAVRVLRADPGFHARRLRLQRIAQRLTMLPWDSISSARIKAGLLRQCKRTDRAGARAKADPSPDNLHRWRRRTRRLRMQFDIVDHMRIARADIPTHASRKLHKRSDTLGWHQDLEILSALLRRLPGITDRKDLLLRLASLGGEVQAEVGEVH